MNGYDREHQQIEDDLEKGYITPEQAHKYHLDLDRQEWEEAQDAAEAMASDVMAERGYW